MIWLKTIFWSTKLFHSKNWMPQLLRLYRIVTTCVHYRPMWTEIFIEIMENRLKCPFGEIPLFDTYGISNTIWAKEHQPPWMSQIIVFISGILIFVAQLFPLSTIRYNMYNCTLLHFMLCTTASFYALHTLHPKKKSLRHPNSHGEKMYQTNMFVLEIVIRIVCHLPCNSHIVSLWIIFISIYQKIISLTHISQKYSTLLMHQLHIVAYMLHCIWRI